MTLAAAMTVVVAQPSVTTDTRYARGATSAYGRLTVKTNGASIRERGFCWATHPQPTVADSKTTTYFSNNGNIYRLENLEPATIYYMRAYVTTTGGDSYYGDDIKMSTLPMGTMTISYDNGSSDATENARIAAAAQGAIDYWNRLTGIKGFTPSVHYSAGTPTADCSYGGWIRMGANASYQRIGTIMHEMLHGIGVGTHWLWYGPSFMRANSTRGAWLGDRAQDLIRFWDNNDSAILNGDNTHLWPYGINGAHEDNGTEQLYTITSLIAEAVGEDGLPPTSGCFALPYYSFVQEDTVKYYIKSEDTRYGRNTAFLTEGDAMHLRVTTMSTEAALSNDSAAWYVTFTPANQFYQLRNAATGHVMTYAATGTNGIRLAARSGAAQANDNFQLMPSRQDVVIGTGADQQHKRSLWLLHPQGGSATALVPSATGLLTTQGFDLQNEATQQRWLLLTAREAELLEQSGQAEQQDILAATIGNIRALMQVPHQPTDGQDADAILNADLSRIEAEAVGASATVIDSLVTAAQLAANSFLLGVVPTDMDQPFDLSFRIVTPNFTGNSTDGWEGGTSAGVNYDCVEFFEQNFDFYQLLPNMPAGTYRFEAQAFSRPGTTSAAWTSFNLSGNARLNARIYVGTGATASTRTLEKLRHIAEGRQPSALDASDVQVGDEQWVPNTMAGAAKYFAQRLYPCSVMRAVTDAQLTASNGQLRVGFRDAQATTSHWTIFTQTRLYYYGQLTPEQITSVATLTADQDDSRRHGVYSLTGVRMGDSLHGLAPGIYVVNGKKVALKR